MKTSSMTIGNRITLGFGILCLLVGLVGGITWQGLRGIRANANYIHEGVIPGLINSGGFSAATSDNFVRTLLYSGAATAEERAQWKRDMDAASTRIGDYMKAYEAAITTPEDRTLFGELNKLREEYRQARTVFLGHVNSDKKEAAHEFLNATLLPTFQSYSAMQAKLFTMNSTNGRTNAESIDTSSARTTRFVIWLTLAALLAGILVGAAIVRGTNRLLLGLATHLNEGAELTATATAQVASASQKLAEGATQQAASLQETSASMEEMTSIIKRNAESASKASEIATRTRTAAEDGSSDVQAMSVAMNEIKDSSNEVARIVKTIDEIAFQTNILALNAAVEAARAGESGAGFAVVADEVRSLAGRCAASARETAEKITVAIARSERGVEISTRVSTSFGQISGMTREVDQLVGEIATASREQSQGIQQVNLAMTEMDKVTQNTAAIAEESASAAEELNAQADAVRESVGQLQDMVGAHASARTAGDALSPASAPTVFGTLAPAARRSSPVRKTSLPLPPLPEAKADEAFTNF